MEFIQFFCLYFRILTAFAMKRIILFMGLVFIVTTLMAQAPQAINYQAVLRGSANWLLSNQDVNIRISILKGSTSGPVVYKESHSTTTNLYGLVNLSIGTGTVLAGDFDNIDWAGSSHFINIEADTSDGTNFYDMGTTQLVSVPFALESNHTSSLTLADTLGNRYHVMVDTNGNLYTEPILMPTWNCGEDFTDPDDGQEYTTVMIGTQCWMAENLNKGTMVIPGSSGYQQFDNGVIEKYCYNNTPSNCDIYGALYEWPEAMQYVTTEGAQGICPEGWHIPAEAEWSVLELYLGGNTVAGGKMKATGTIQEGTGLWKEPNTGATNESNFTAVPAGRRHRNGTFYLSVGENNFIWSSTELNSTNTYTRTMGYSYATLFTGPLNKDHGHTVRCLKD